MKTALTCLGLIALAVSTAFGQTAFEVISIKPNDSMTSAHKWACLPGGTLNAKNVPIKALIQQAYDVRDFQVSGGPGVARYAEVRHHREERGYGRATGILRR